MKFRTCIIFSFLAVYAQAQSELVSRIPAQVGFVLSFNLNSLSGKINFNDLGEYAFLKKTDDNSPLKSATVLKELFRLPEKGGIDRKGKMFLFSENHDSIHNFSYLIPLSDANAFESRIEEILKNKKTAQKFKKDGKRKLLMYEHTLSISLLKNYALISIWDLPYYSQNDYVEYDAERLKVIGTLDSIRYARESEYSDSVSAVEEVVEAPDSASETEEEESDTAVVSEEEELAVEAEDEVAAPEVEYYEGEETDYSNDSLMVQFERRWALKRKLEEEKFYVIHDQKMSKRQKQISELKASESIINSKQFNEVISKSDDIIYWFQYESYSKQLIDMMSDKHRYLYQYDTALLRRKLENKPANTLAELIDNNSLYGLGNFNKGEVKMNFYSTFNSKLKPYIEKIYSTNINPEFFNYVKKENLMALAGASANTEAAAEMYYDIFRRAYESSAIPRKELIAMLELSDLFLDKKTLHHTLKGDMAIAFTGIKSYLKTSSEYLYDSITFNYKTVEKTKTKYFPEILAMATIENESNVRRILKLIQNMDGLKKVSDNKYVFNSRYMDTANPFYAIIKGNLLFITNDQLMANGQIENGLSPDLSVGANYKEYLNYTSFGFWEASKMFKLMQGNEEAYGKADELEKWRDKINRGFFVCKPMQNNTSSIEVSLEMKNRENSSLLELLKLFNDIAFFNNGKL